MLPFDLYGKTVLIVGFGRIGSRTAKRCLAFEMKVQVYDPYKDAADIKAAGCEPVTDLDAALPSADFVTIHCPKTPETVGLFDGARCYIFATSWKAPVEDQEPILAGMFGKTELLDDRYRIGGLSLVDVLGQTVGETYSPQCPKTFGSTGFAGCKVPLAPNTVSGTLTHVSSASAFRDSARTEPDDTFGAGTIRFTSGPNAGLKPLEVRSYSADGSVTTFEPFYYLPVAGNTYTAIRGCRKRMSDCQARAGGSNIVNFGGFPWIPTSSTYSQVGQN
jgi:uncharacterized phage protein (TIGR02218 family)